MQIKQQPCFAHTLNLVVQDAIKTTTKVKKAQEKLKRIVSNFHHIVKASDKLREIQNQNCVQNKKTDNGCGHEVELLVLYDGKVYRTT